MKTVDEEIREDCVGCFVKRYPPVGCDIIKHGLFDECPCKICLVKCMCISPNSKCTAFEEICGKIMKVMEEKIEAKASKTANISL